ncbi:hypothetical protein [Cohnella sp. AR92]|uniref:hypothetical protein n=1 Tax=Cohnella sp. AR92 TaxID=648716 RepID=UPI000F8D4080|nr:hypothetical protein [Cohnella sp. AR92]RUS47937.1 hypothetical protein ELR57_05215 [Cohnella sp. AR92]
MNIRNGLRAIFKKQLKSVPDLRPSFLLHHNGGEIWVSCIDNLGSDIHLIREKISNNEDLMRTKNKQFRVLYHIDGTAVTYEIAGYMTESLSRSSQNIFKIAIVGANRTAKNNIRKRLTKEVSSLGINYFSSIDQAKDWLVSERF